MRRLLLVVCLSFAPVAAQSIPDDQPAEQVQVQTQQPEPATSVTVNQSNTPWWTSAVLFGFLTSVATGFFSFRLGSKKQADDAITQRDNQDLTAIQMRDKAFTDILGQLTSMTGQLSQQAQLVAENAANKARLDDLVLRNAEQEARERELLSKVGKLEVRVNQIEGCQGGSPCPFAGMKRGES